MTDFSNTLKRLEIVIRESKTSPRSFAIKAGIDPSNLSKMRNGNLDVSVKTARKIEMAYGVSVEWLLYGRGPKECNIIQVPKPSGIPVYGSCPVSAGQYDLARFASTEKPTGYIDMPELKGALGVFPIVGCSMEPLIKAGDYIAVTEIDSYERIDPDKVYLIITLDDRMIKHLSVDNEDDGILWCISENESYSKFRISKMEIRKIYRVVFHGRLL